MSNKYYRIMYKMLHIYKEYHVSYRCFKKASIKKFNKYKKMLSSAYGYIDTDNCTLLGLRGDV